MLETTDYDFVLTIKAWKNYHQDHYSYCHFCCRHCFLLTFTKSTTKSSGTDPFFARGRLPKNGWAILGLWQLCVRRWPKNSTCHELHRNFSKAWRHADVTGLQWLYGTTSWGMGYYSKKYEKMSHFQRIFHDQASIFIHFEDTPFMEIHWNLWKSMEIPINMTMPMGSF